MTRLIKALTLIICVMAIHPAQADDISPNPKNLTFTQPNQSAWIKHNTSKTSLSPANPLNQAKMLARSGQLEAALLLIKTALELNNQDYHAWNTLGEIHQKLGHSAQAMKAFNKAHELDPDLATTCEYG